MLQSLVRQQIWLSRRFDTLLPPCYSLDGNYDYTNNILPNYIERRMHVYDIGGGSRPYLQVAKKVASEIEVTGIDIDPRELAAAPPGSYDRVITADITRYVGSGDADLVICQATLEHVRDATAAFAALASIPRPGGRICIFVPCRNAIYARLNRLLPESVKRFLLFKIFPDKADGHEGFEAYYDRCTPKEFRLLAKQHGLEVEFEKQYFESVYFTFFSPLHVLWRLWMVGARRIAGEEAAETFVLVLRRPGDGGRERDGEGVTAGQASCPPR